MIRIWDGEISPRTDWGWGWDTNEVWWCIEWQLWSDDWSIVSCRVELADGFVTGDRRRR